MPKPGLRRGAGAGPAPLVREVREIDKNFETTNFIVGGAGGGGRKKKTCFFFEFFPDFQKRGLPWEKAFLRILQSVESRFVKNRNFRENSRNFRELRAAGATAPLPQPVFSSSDFFSKISQFLLIFY